MLSRTREGIPKCGFQLINLTI